MKALFKRIPLVLLVTILISCGPSTKESKSDKIQIVATTGMVADAAKALMGTHAEIHSLMGPGVDPHLYKATQGDVSLLQDADVILYSGHHLEGKMGDIFEKLNRSKPCFAFTETLPESDLIYADANIVDPHIWFNPILWSKCVHQFSLYLQELYPAFADEISDNSTTYLLKIAAVDTEIEALMEEIPAEKRILVTSHDAFEYFGSRYKVEVNALQGISTAAEFGLHDLNELIEFCIEKNLKSIFVESSVNQKSIRAVVEGAKDQGHTLYLASALYSDALGAKGTEEESYLGVLRYNAKTINAALK